MVLVMCTCQTKAYYVTLEVPVQVTCRVQVTSWEDAMTKAREQVGKDGLESYYMEYDVEDQASITKVEEEG